jgi:predicted nuclease of predicted toxin-antitoxin system
MRLLLDQGLPRSAVRHLKQKGLSAMHAADVDLSTAADVAILEYCRREGLIIVTLDADFHAQLALSHAAAPSVIRVRIEGLRGEGIARVIAEVVQACASDLEHGAMISVQQSGIRVRRILLLL